MTDENILVIFTFPMHELLSSPQVNLVIIGGALDGGTPGGGGGAHVTCQFLEMAKSHIYVAY